jgi:serpin B
MFRQPSWHFLALISGAIFFAASAVAEGPVPALDKSAQRQTVQQALTKTIDWNFVETPLVEVAETIQKDLQVPVHLDRKGLSEEGIPADTPINFKLSGVSAKSALGLMLHELHLDLIARGEALVITSLRAADGDVFAVAYDVGDLVLVGDGSDEPDFDSLIDMITKTIKPTSWDSVGGNGSVQPFQSGGIEAIVVSQCDEVQAEVARLLADLRALRHTSVKRAENLPPLAATPAEKQQARAAVQIPWRGEEERILAALNKTVDWNFNETPLAAVADKLYDELKIPVLLDRKALADLNIIGETPITFKMSGVSAKSGLSLMLRDLLGLTAIAHEGVLLITTPEVADGDLRTLTYDVTDLVLVEGEGSDVDFDSIIDLITKTIAPVSWDCVGGPGSISPFESLGIKSLAILQTEEVQEKVAELLADLRALRRPSSKGQADESATSGPTAAAPAKTSALRTEEDKIDLALQKKINWNFENKPLVEVVEALREDLNVRLHLDVKSMSELGIQPDTRLSFSVSDVAAKNALELMLRELGLTITLRDQVLLIASCDAADANMLVRTYDVSDLPAYRTEKGQAVPDYDSLIDTITRTIRPTTWDGVGGTGSVQPINTGGVQALVVNQTWQVQEQIGELLDNLRKLRKTPLTKDGLAKLPPLPPPVDSLEGALPGFGGLARHAARPVKPLPPLDPDPARDTIVAANNQFAIDLYRELREKDRNLFFSPFSIATALAMAHAGARGQTADEIAKALHFSLNQDEVPRAYQSLLQAILPSDRPGCELNVANRLWCQNGYKFRPSFLDINRNQFGSEVGLVDFEQSDAVRKQMSDWIGEKTKNRIQNAIQPGVIHDRTRFAIVNAIYFKGKWQDQFPKSATKDGPFYDGDRTVRVPMMALTDTRHRYAEIDGVQILEKPYLGGDISMLIVLPRRNPDAFALNESQLTLEKLKEWDEALGKRSVDVYVPRFKMETSYPLIAAMQRLGMRKAFLTDEADFSGMKENGEPLAIDALVHQTFLQVDEEGTEAVAVTGMFGGMGGPSPNRLIFRADHPFLFLIRDTRTGCILFLGRVLLPPHEEKATG